MLVVLQAATMQSIGVSVGAEMSAAIDVQTYIRHFCRYGPLNVGVLILSTLELRCDFVESTESSNRHRHGRNS
jgi:hypothetical protein